MFLWWLSGKESTCNARDSGNVGSVPGSGRSPGGGLGKPLEYSCLENSVNSRAQWAAVCRVAKSDKTEATEHAYKLTVTPSGIYTKNKKITKVPVIILLEKRCLLLI